ncbi:Uncharacterized protein ChrSV_1710 [Chromobacterium vaccinii]|nr:Uncharacterized protein ChrSW_1710 [Chromobacterium vaccinii]QND89168.1 Uncharacterized protein ChrSV_1710 [Chromobacterium vaccinii]
MINHKDGRIKRHMLKNKNFARMACLSDRKQAFPAKPKAANPQP